MQHVQRRREICIFSKLKMLPPAWRPIPSAHGEGAHDSRTEVKTERKSHRPLGPRGAARCPRQAGYQSPVHVPPVTFIACEEREAARSSLRHILVLTDRLTLRNGLRNRPNGRGSCWRTSGLSHGENWRVLTPCGLAFRILWVVD